MINFITFKTRRQNIHSPQHITKPYLGGTRSYLIDRIRIVLCLEANGRMFGVDNTTLSNYIVHVVSRVQLHPRLGGVHLQPPPTPPVVQAAIGRHHLPSSL